MTIEAKHDRCASCGLVGCVERRRCTYHSPGPAILLPLRAPVSFDPVDAAAEAKVAGFCVGILVACAFVDTVVRGKRMLGVVIRG